MGMRKHLTKIRQSKSYKTTTIQPFFSTFASQRKQNQ